MRTYGKAVLKTIQCSFFSTFFFGFYCVWLTWLYVSSIPLLQSKSVVSVLLLFFSKYLLCIYVYDLNLIIAWLLLFSFSMKMYKLQVWFSVYILHVFVLFLLLLLKEWRIEKKSARKIHKIWILSGKKNKAFHITHIFRTKA